MRYQKQRKVKSLTLGHTATTYHSQDSNAGYWAPKGSDTLSKSHSWVPSNLMWGLEQVQGGG